MLEIGIYVVGGVIAFALIFGLRALAAKYADGQGAKARVKFAEMEGFAPGEVCAFGKSGIAIDERGEAVALLAEDGSVHMLDLSKVAGWYAGMVNMHEDRKYAKYGLMTLGAAAVTSTVRTAWAPYLFLFDAEGAVWFRLGFATEKICTEWREKLRPVLGEDKEQDTPHLRSGPAFGTEDEVTQTP